ncbi:NUDIX hydrolase [Mucilaginibacter defluvii]|uniref:NUDIX domain-containing protein n=1 Tax=Mucilaginibacter defluvii TaxID=1196019 RepID=A0ABP9FY66_9SPHI
MELIEHGVTNLANSYPDNSCPVRPHKRKARVLLTVECLAFCFQDDFLKILLFKGDCKELSKWSFAYVTVGESESPDDTAQRLMYNSTGISTTFLEQLHTRDGVIKSPGERVVSITFIALLDASRPDKSVDACLEGHWFTLDKMPKLRHDQRETVNSAINHLRYKAALHPLLFELLPERFTLPQIQNLYDSVYNAHIDKRNLSKRILSTGLLIKTPEKDKSSKKGASYYCLNKTLYNPRSLSLIKLLPNLHTFTGR